MKLMKAILAACALMAASGAVYAALSSSAPIEPTPIQGGETTEWWCPPYCW